MGEVPGMNLGQYVAVLRGRWLLILVTTILGGLVAAGYLALVPTSYTATAAVQINVISSDPFQSSQSASDLIDGRTEASIATSFAVASLASEQFEFQRNSNEIREFTEATPVADATVLEISYTAAGPESARDGADTIAASYLNYRETQAQVRLSSMIEMIDDQLDGLRRDLVQANAQSAIAKPNSSEANQAASDRELITIEINSLITRKNVLESINTKGGVVLTPARENPLETAPSTRTVAASGILGGLLLGVLLAFLVKRLDRRVTSSAEINRLTGSRVLAELPDVEAAIPPLPGDLAALRLLREEVLAELPASARTLMILDHSTSTARPAHLAADIALVFAQEQVAVELILPALEKQVEEGVATALQLKEVEDWAGLLSYRSMLVSNLTVVTCAPGTHVTDPDPIITRAVRERLTEKHFAGLRLLALGADVSAPSRLAAQRHCQGALLAVTKSVTHGDRVARSVAELRASDVPLLGVLTVRRGRRGSVVTTNADDNGTHDASRADK